MEAETAALQKVHDLQLAALQAQMNPHFIFNALNSIQSFVLTGDKTRSARYLSKFSGLVRSTMYLNGKKAITLQQEVAMLRSYLELEQLRFDGKFSWDVIADGQLDPYEVQLPPMLVQPFVENALLHGIAPKDGHGQVMVCFAKIGSRLQVTITDDGIGIGQALQQAARKNGHQSMGIGIVEQRLAGLGPHAQLDVQELKSETGKVMGTEVRLKLPLA